MPPPRWTRCLRAGALALGATVEIVTIPGYFPLLNDPGLSEVFRGNAERLVGASSFASQPSDRQKGGSTDMGDLSQIMPVIHPYTGGCSGTGHGDDYRVVDHDQAVIRPAKAIAMTVIDLLTNDAARGKQLIENSRPPMTKESYLALQDSRMSEETYTSP